MRIGSLTEFADAAVREEALDPAHSFIVGAPAGSGKTTLLTQRFLRLLSLVPDPEMVVAITFTRKAAEEMRARVLAALRSAQENASDFDAVTRHWAAAALAASEQHGWRLLEFPRRLRMQTIDSMAGAIARRGPLRSGYTGDVALLDDPETLYQRAARAAIGELGSNDIWSAAVRVLLGHLDNNWERLERLLAEMLSRRDQWLRFVVQQPERDEFEGSLAHAIAGELGIAADIIPDRFVPEIVRIGAFAGSNLAQTRPDDERVQLAAMVTLPAAAPEAMPLWRALGRLFLTSGGDWRRTVTKNDGFPPAAQDSAGYKPAFLELVEQLREVRGLRAALHNLQQLPDPFYRENDWASLDALFRVLKLAAAQLKIEFDRAGAVDFAEVGQCAIAALGGTDVASELQLLLDYQIQHLLIDEFQDTSIAQFELIERLTEGWGGDDGRSLFLVGDPMQSIYRFREADVSLFVNTAATGRLGSVALRTLQLTTNFRSQSGLVEWLNDAVGVLQQTDVAAFDTLPTLVAARPRAAGAAVTVHGLVDANANADAETDKVVELVTASLARNPAYRVGVLVRSRNHLGALGEKLRTAGIAVTASDVDRLSSQSVILDLTALTRALLHLADRTAWLACLRAPWCGLHLTELIALFEGARDALIVDRLTEILGGNSLDASTRDRLAACFPIIEHALLSIGRESVTTVVERTWIALQGPSCYPVHAMRLAARYFDLLAAREERGEVLSAQTIDAMLAGEYVAPPPQSSARVDIMTMHAAKGLEFDVVILPGLSRTPRPESRRLLEWRAHHNDSGTHLLFAPIGNADMTGAPISEFLRRAERLESEEEAYRLLYVAMTRARESLHLVGSLETDDDREIKSPQRGSFFGMMWPAVAGNATIVHAATIASPAEVASIPALRRFVEPIDVTARVASPPDSSHADARTDIEFSWASPTAKHIGTVTHAILQRISVDGIDAWSPERVAGLAAVIDSRLRGFGVPAEAVAAARVTIVNAVSAAIASTRGRWILGSEHEQCASEYAMTAVTDGRVENVIIDRTFIDEHGQRWIIDFKTGAHTGGATDAFIASEVERYRPQLDRYAGIMQRDDPRQIQLGLFFPLLDEWREWRFQDTTGAPS